jgi:formylglycine-generating enzyme required for sulfatase activity
MDAKVESAPQAGSRARIFISYSRKDMAFADRLEAALKARGFEPLIDRNDVYFFDPWWERIQSLIGESDTVIFVLSPDSVKSDVALKEVAHAACLSKRFAPIVCRRVDDSTVPEALRRLNFIFFDDPESFDDDVNKLAEALQTDIVWIRDHTKFGEAARGWVVAGRPNGLLLHTPALEMAEYWIASRPRSAPEPTEETRSFVAASRKAEIAARRRSRVLNAAVYTLLVGIILGLVGWINQSAIADEWRFLTVTWPYERANVRPYVLNVVKERALKPGESFKECAQDCPEMVVVPAGSIVPRVPGARTTVTFVKPFAVSKYELRFADWDACISGGGCSGYRPNDQHWGRGQQPAIYVNWDDAQQYVAWLSQVTGKTYRLLSEAEYEYATRAGTTTEYPWGDDLKRDGQAMAVCLECGSRWDGKQTAPVGSFPPNKFGLYDVVGNVWEWTDDCLNYEHGGEDCTNRLVRGGSWDVNQWFLRSDARARFSSVSRLNNLGFRVARTLLAP